MGDDCMWVFVSTFLATWFGFMVFDIRFLSRRKWAGLTEEELDEAMKYWSDDSRSTYGGARIADGEYVNMRDTWRYIEAKLKEKNT